MTARRTSALPGRRALTVAASLIIASGALAGCGPSEQEIRADLNEVCLDLVEDLSGLDAEPAFGLLAYAADEARHEFGSAAYQVGDISSEGSADELASALDAISDAYDDLEAQLTRREYASLAATREAAQAALADALAAAQALGADDCEGIGVRAGYFDIAAEGADEALARIAPTGDYVADVNAACGRYAGDTLAVSLKYQLQAFLTGDTVAPDAGDYIEAIEDLLVLGIALDVLDAELEALEPPAGAGPTHRLLIDGFRIAREGFRSLRDDGGIEQVIAGARQVAEAADSLGVECEV